MVMKEENNVEVCLAKISGDLDHIKTTMVRLEEFAYSMNKRLQQAENQIAYIKGGFFVFVAVFTIALSVNSFFLK
tara:strand:+ start:1649 stop:1873 length:225 start_codon:yes stop_codon:yes gene_type:complete